MFTPPVGGKTSIERGIIFLVAALMGGAVTGVLVFLMGEALRATSIGTEVVQTFVLMVALLIVTSTAFRRDIPKLTPKWLVPRRWAAYGGKRFAALFGFHLGLGWRTDVSSNLFWVLIMGTALEPNFIFVAIPFLLFAVVRAMPVALIAYVRARITPHYVGQLTLLDVQLMKSFANSAFVQYGAAISAGAVGVGVILKGTQ